MNHLADFLPHVGSTFEIRYPDGFVIPLTLEAASDLGSTPAQEQFSLLFKGPLQYPLGQSAYALTHAAMDEQILLLVPTAKEDDGFIYQAVFNRLVRA